MSDQPKARYSQELQDDAQPSCTDTSSEKASALFSRDIETGTQSTTRQDETPDPDLVGWDGLDDPENPMNWPKHRKIINVSLISLFTFLAPLATSIFAPAIDLVMDGFGENSPELASFIVSVYLLGQCFGSLIIAPLSELYGRLIMYHICHALFVLWTVGCALSPNIGALIGFRFLAGLMGSCPMTLGAGSIADMIPREKRGKYMSVWIFGPLWGPAIGPVLGGYLSEAMGWRWSLWLVVILTGAALVPSWFVMRESYAVVLLQRKADRLRKETGNSKLRSEFDTELTQGQVIKLAIIRPMKMLLFSPATILMAVYFAFIFGEVYVLLTGLSFVFDRAYGFDPGEIGLTFLGFGVGSMAGLFVVAAYSDRIMNHLVEANGGQRLPKYRLPFGILGGVVLPIGLLWFGWSADQKAHWIVPIIGTAVFGVGGIFSLMTVQTYLVDAFEQYAASAIAANMVLRNLVGALLPLGGRRLFETLGIGWGNSLLAFIGIALVPFPLMLWKYGERIRRKTLFGVKI